MTILLPLKNQHLLNLFGKLLLNAKTITKITRNVIKNLDTALEVEAKIGTAALSRRLKANLPTTSDVVQ